MSSESKSSQSWSRSSCWWSCLGAASADASDPASAPASDLAPGAASAPASAPAPPSAPGAAPADGLALERLLFPRLLLLLETSTSSFEILARTAQIRRPETHLRQNRYNGYNSYEKKT